MEKKIVYQFDIDKKIWEKFKICLRKKYYVEGISIHQWLLNTIEKFIKENYEEKTTTTLTGALKVGE